MRKSIVPHLVCLLLAAGYASTAAESAAHATPLVPTPDRPAIAHTDIGPILDQISGERIWTTIDSLSGYWTRRCGTQENYWVGESLMRRILELGYDEAYFDSLACDVTGRAERNIVFLKPGMSSPEEYVIVGAHYDCIAPGGMAVRAPGADDNASGVAGVLEMARITRDLRFGRSVIFVLFTCEEVGLVGSQHFVDELLETGLDVTLYINLDCVAYTDGSWQAYVRTLRQHHSLGRAAAALISEYTEITPRTLGRLSDYWPFEQAGIATIDIYEEPLNPRINGPRDSLHYLNEPYAEDMVRGILATLLLTGRLDGLDIPIAPATFLQETCATEVWGLPPGARAVFRWWGEDFDGSVVGYEYRLLNPSQADTGYHLVPAGVESLAFTLDEEGPYRFEVRSVDDDGLRDWDPPSATVSVGMSFAHPELHVEADVGGWASFKGAIWTSEFPDTLFAGEQVEFRWSASAEDYCSQLVGYSWAWDDTFDWHPQAPSLSETLVAVSLEPGEHVLYVRAIDDIGYETKARVSFYVTAIDTSGGLLLVDDFDLLVVDDPMEDAFFDTLLATQEWRQWDPHDHAAGAGPLPPPVAALAGARHVLWSVDGSDPVLAGLSVGGYNSLEGYVRAGGNLVLAGMCPTKGLAGFQNYPADFGPGDFLYDYAGLVQSRNTGGRTNPNPPNRYGYAFLGAAAAAPDFADAYVDTLGKWGSYYTAYGGIPYCDAFDTAARDNAIYLFQSHVNAAFQDAPCVARRFGTGGEGSVAIVGFPLYFLKTSQARAMVSQVLNDFERWTIPAELLSFEWQAFPDSIQLSWTVESEAGVQGFWLWRRDNQQDTFDLLNDEMLHVLPQGAGSFTDESVTAGLAYEYKLGMVERWGGTSLHGPWAVSASPPHPTTLALTAASANPFTADVELSIAVPSPAQRIVVEVFDVGGRKVATICDREFQPGVHLEVWDGLGSADHSTASGVYFIRATGRAGKAACKIVRVR